MRRSGVRFPKAALKPRALAIRLFGRILKMHYALVGLAWKPRGPHLIRIQFREGPVELIRNSIEIVRKEPGVNVECHGRRGVAEHSLHCLDVGACRNCEAGGGVTQFVRGESRQSGLLGGRVEEPRSEVGVPQRAAFGAVKTRSPGAFPASWAASWSARKRGIGTDRR
jgi:hypothetical protein